MKEYVYKGQVYTSINQLAQATTIHRETLRKMLAPFSETEGRIEVTQLIEDYLKKRDNQKKYVYKGQVYPSINKLAQATTIPNVTLSKMLAPFSETEGRIEVTQLIEDYLKKRDNQKKYVYKGQVYTLYQLSQATTIYPVTLRKMLAPFSETEGRIEVTELIDDYLKKRDNPREYVYNGQVYPTIKQLSQATTIHRETLSKMLAPFSETEGRIEVTQLIEDYLKKRDNPRVYVYKGQVYPTQKQLSQATTIHPITLSKMLAPFSETEGRIDVTQLIDDYLKKRDNPRVYVYKGQVYPTINQLAQATTISDKKLTKMLAPFSETEGRIDVTQLIDDYLNKRGSKREYIIKTYTYLGKEYSSILALANEVGIKHGRLRRAIIQCDGNAEKAIMMLKTKDSRKDKEYVYKGHVYTSIHQLAQATTIDGKILKKMLAPFSEIEGRIEVTQLIDDYLNKRGSKREYTIKTYTYLGKEYSSILALANEVGITDGRLRRAIIQCDGNAEKAIMMLKTKDSRKDKVLTKDGSELSLADMATILGIKQEEMNACLDRGMSIDQIRKYASDKKTNRSLRGTGSLRLMYDEKTTLAAYCIKNKLNYSCIYYMVTEYGKTIPEAIKHYRMNGQEIPADWIHERYDILLKHLLLDAKLDYQKVITAMRQNLMPLREALEYVVVRDDAREKDLDPEWQHEIYSLYTDTGLSEKERQECMKAFYITPKEIDIIEKSKEKVNQLERQLDLYEIAECIRDRLFTEEETVELLKLYKVSYQEGEKAIRDFCNKFQNGVLRTSEQQEGLKNNKSIMNRVTEILNRYAKLMKQGQADSKAEMIQPSKLSEENPAP